MNRHRVVAKLIQWSVPLLNIFRNPEEWPYSLEELERMDEGSLGNELFWFLNSRSLGYLPKYEIHDCYHTLLGYGTTVTEELKLQAFMWGNKNSTFAGRVLFILGCIVFPAKHTLFKAVLSRGKRSVPLKPINVTEILSRKLTELRKELCIK